MSLPKHFHLDNDYFLEALEFLTTHQYLFNFPNTHLLVENALDKIDISHTECMNINETSTKLEDLNDKFIVKVLNQINRLTPDLRVSDSSNEGHGLKNVPLSPKKMHEIECLAKEIKEVCDTKNCDTIVDFGSGLGYLDQYLNDAHNFKVVGFEINKKYVQKSIERQQKYFEGSQTTVKYINYKIEPNSYIAIQKNVNKIFPDTHFCMTGLHACADLSTNAIDLFLKMEQATSFVFMPCCYHKMLENPSGGFNKFPVSDTLMSVMTGKYEEFIKVPFMRLASEGSGGEKSMEIVVFRLLARAVLQLFCERYNLRLSRKKRKAVKCENPTDFVFYIKEALLNGYELNCRTCDTRIDFNELLSSKEKCIDDNLNFVISDCKCFDKRNNLTVEEILELWKHYSSVAILKRTAIFVMLQRKLQIVLENLIIYDRICYLKQHPNIDCYAKRIVNPNISPRCYAIIARKINI